MKRFIFAGLFLLSLCASTSCEKEEKEAQFPDDYFGYWKLSNVEFYYDGELVDSDFQEAYISFYGEGRHFSNDYLNANWYGYEYNNPDNEYIDHIDIDKIKKYDIGYISIQKSNYSSSGNYWNIETIGHDYSGEMWGSQSSKFLDVYHEIRILEDLQLVKCSGNTLYLSGEAINSEDNTTKIYGYSTSPTNIEKDGKNHDIKFIFRFDRGTEEEFNQYLEQFREEYQEYLEEYH